MNDREVNEHCVALRLLARKLSELQAGPDENKLFKALSDIEMAAKKGQERLNDLKYGRAYKPPEEQMGT